MDYGQSAWRVEIILVICGRCLFPILVVFGVYLGIINDWFVFPEGPGSAEWFWVFGVLTFPG